MSRARRWGPRSDAGSQGSREAIGMLLVVIAILIIVGVLARAAR